MNAAQVLEVEEVQRGRGLRVADGTHHGLLQDAVTETPRRDEVPITDEA